jgi:CDP-2,3-bis-(O-geranylgeranyl)-sn-glycerol synthase
VLAALVFRHRASWPIDAGRVLRDGQRLLGSSKTWRGLLCSALAAAVTAIALGLDPALGVVFAALAMTGDLGTSFLKRRCRLPSGASVLGLDQLPEALLPLWMLQARLDLELHAMMVTAALFLVLDLIGTRLVASLKS